MKRKSDNVLISAITNDFYYLLAESVLLVLLHSSKLNKAQFNEAIRQLSNNK